MRQIADFALAPANPYLPSHVETVRSESVKNDPLENLEAALREQRILVTEQAAAFCGYSVPQWRDLYKSGGVPAPIRLSTRKYGWRVATLNAWLEKVITSARGVSLYRA